MLRKFEIAEKLYELRRAEGKKRFDNFLRNQLICHGFDVARRVNIDHDYDQRRYIITQEMSADDSTEDRIPVPRPGNGRTGKGRTDF